ncbi:MAG TPA: hypothetical protein VF829_03605 [Candidatus Paceibacterota bacterium]
MNTNTAALSPVESLIAALNLSAYSPEEQEQLLMDLSDTIFEGTLVRLIGRMDDKTRGAFSSLMDQNASGDEVATFLKEHVPGSDEVALDVVRDITDDIVSLHLEAPEAAS